MSALRAVEQPVPAIVARPATVATVESWADLQALLDRWLEGIESDLGDGETMGHLGMHGRARLEEKRATLLDIAFAITEAVAQEAFERAEAAASESVEQRYRAAGYESMEPLAQRAADGDR